MGTRHADRRGISLLEVMISMSVLLVVFASISMLLTTTRRTQETVLEEESALFHAEGIKEALAGATFNQIPLDDGAHFPADWDGADPYTGTDITTLPSGDSVVKSLQNEWIVIDYPGWDWAGWVAAGQDPNAIPDPLTIRIVVAWNTVGGSRRTLELTVARSSSVPN